MAQLPTGTVTFLFTDVEGSTRLLEEFGAERYAEALAEHRRVLREAFGRHEGVEVDTQGDAFFVAFPEPAAALEAAEAGQRALAPTPIRVRMGVHTGSPLVTDHGYVGFDVHKAARVAAAGPRRPDPRLGGDAPRRGRRAASARRSPPEGSDGAGAALAAG